MNKQIEQSNYDNDEYNMTVDLCSPFLLASCSFISCSQVINCFIQQ